MSTHSPTKIAIILYERDVRALSRPYRLWAIRKVWEEWGIEVVVQRGIDRRVDADLVIPHFDLTIVPEPYLRYLDDYPLVMNRQVDDVSKRRISDNLLRMDDDHEGPVIVKTNRNYGGLPDRELLLDGGASSGIAAKFAHGWERLKTIVRPIDDQALASVQALPPRSYRIFGSLKDVPPGVFGNDALVVERFLPELDDGLYCVRGYTFCGDTHLSEMKKAKFPIVKSEWSVAREEIPVDPSIVAVRKQLGFDFGKFDYVVNDGKTILLDVTRTPTMAGGLIVKAKRRIASGNRFADPQRRIEEGLAKGALNWFAANAKANA